MNILSPRSQPSSETALATPWWRGASIYQIYPRSFADSNGDGIGDLPGITARLDHVADLGVDAVWISPFYTSPMCDFGYDIADYRGVDPIFGTMADFDALVAKAHGLGLKLLVDQVYSHTSDQHEWFVTSRSNRTNAKADWYVWADAKPDGSPPSNWQSVFGGPAWRWDARRGQYYLHNFLAEQPQLNGHNPDVQNALLDVARFWLDRGVDGLRVDAINFAMHDPQLRDNPPAPDDGRARTRPFNFQQHLYNQSHPDIPYFIKRVRALTDSYEAIFTVAEVGGPDPQAEMHAFTSGDAHFNSAYSFDFLYAEQLTPALVRDALAQWQGDGDEGWPSWAFANHDAPRWISRWAPVHARAAYARMVMALFIALRGNIIFWQGEELGLTQVEIEFEHLQDPEAIANWPLTLSRDGSRTPMVWCDTAPHGGFSSGEPWLPIGDDHLALAVSQQTGDDGSLLELTRRLLGVRQANAALCLGSMTVETASENLLLFHRDHDGQRMICAYNMGAEPLLWSGPNGNILVSVNGATTDHLPAYSGIIIESV
ncbi:MAG: alpha-amylase family glycosyl hydrolase [Pseudomonadota bacterium]